jgi:hypothetical protein
MPATINRIRHRANGHNGHNGHARRPVLNGTNGHAAMPPEHDGSADGKATPSDRGSDGKFKKGNSAGKQFGSGQVIARGNPTYRKRAELVQTMLKVVTPERLTELVESLLRRATDGDALCAKLVLQYCLGKSPAAVDPDCQNLHEWSIAAAFPSSAAVMACAHDAVPPGPAADLVRIKASLAGTPEQVTDKIHRDYKIEPQNFTAEYHAEKEARRRRPPRA